MAGSQRTCRASVPARKPEKASQGAGAGKTPPPPPTGILRTEVLVPTKALTKDLKRRLGMGEAGGAESGCRPGAFPAPAHRRLRGAAFPPHPASGRPCPRRPWLLAAPLWSPPPAPRGRLPAFLWGRQSCCIRGPPSPVPLAFPWLHLQRPPSQTGAHSQVLGGHDVLRGCYSTGKRMAWKHRASPPPGAGAGMPAAPTKRSGSHVQGPLLPRSL